MSDLSERLLADILAELRADADECEYIRQNGTANAIDFDIFDIIGLLGHPVKGYTIKNDGAANLFVGHNMTPNSIDPILDVNTTRFSTIFAGENRDFKFNRDKIRNVYIKSASGNVAYRLWLLW